MNNQSDFRVFFSKALEIAPRVLGHQDSNILSPSYGIFERKYWGWKASPLADASNQYAVYYLGLLWSCEEESNPYYHNDNILELICAGILSWCNLQKRNGSFDQIFYNEHSVGATAYTLLAIVELRKIIGDRLEKGIKLKMDQAIERASRFLLSNDETYAVISNHSALFAYNFHEIWTFAKDDRFKAKCAQQIDLILKNSSQEGWFREYQGADPGYMSQAMYYLVKLKGAGYKVLEKPIDLAIKQYLPYFIHPDGSMGGCYGSRNTTIFYPAGIALLCSQYPQALKILKCMSYGIANGNSVSPVSLDLPNAFRLAVNYFLAYNFIKKEQDSFKSQKDYCLPWEQDKLYKKFPEAGQVAVSTPDYYAVSGVKKGGVLRVFDKKNRCFVCEDNGYFAKLGNKYAATQVFNDSDVEYLDKGFKLNQPFFIVNLKKMSSLKYLLILIFGMTLFHIKFFREKFKKIMVRYLITGSQKTTAFCQRRIIFDDSQIKVVDRIVPPQGEALRGLRGKVTYSTIHMASANYFDFSCLKKRESVMRDLIDQEISLDYVLSFPSSRDAKIKILQ